MLKIYIWGRQLLDDAKGFFKDATVCVEMNIKVGESFKMHGIYNVTKAVQCVYG